MKIYLPFIAITMAMLLLSCGKGTAPNEVSSLKDFGVSDVVLSKPEEANASQHIMSDSTADVVLQAGQPVKPDWDKKIIKTAQLTLELKDYAAYDQMVHASVRRYGAYIANEQQTQQDGKIENIVTIKVPVEAFENLMAALPIKEAKLIEKQVTSEDVTAEVVDTRARTAAKKQVRDRYLELLKQAKNMKEILEVQSEINSIQEDIEAGTGRAEYLVHQSAYSTINLKYYQFIAGATNPDEAPSFVTKVREAFDTGTSIISGTILLLISFWPFLLIATVAWYLVKKVRVKPLSVKNL